MKLGQRPVEDHLDEAEAGASEEVQLDSDARIYVGITSCFAQPGRDCLVRQVILPCPSRSPSLPLEGSWFLTSSGVRGGDGHSLPLRAGHRFQEVKDRRVRVCVEARPT
jgi:hypothetical protein